jgi:hypothetical protein
VQYLVVQRNFDVTQNYPYSPYINGALYYFEIFEDCGKGGLPWSAITEPYPVDAFSNAFTAVTAGGLRGQCNGNGNGNGTSSAGGFYTGLTQDDAMGPEVFAEHQQHQLGSHGSQRRNVLLVTNVQPPQTLSTLPISLLFPGLHQPPATPCSRIIRGSPFFRSPPTL